MPKMSTAERSSSWTVSTRRTPMRVVGLRAILDAGMVGPVGWGCYSMDLEM